MFRAALKFALTVLVGLARVESRMFPPGWLLARGRFVVRALYRLLPGMRAPLQENARHVLGPLSTPAERDHLGRRVLENFSRFFVETLTAPACFPAPEEFLRRIVGAEHGEAALARGRGVIAVTLHMGNFELGAMVFARLHQPLAVVYRRDPFGVVESVRRSKRSAHGVEEIDTERSPFFGVRVLDVLRRGGFALVAADRGFDHPGGEPFPFFDGQARFLTWPARLSIASGAPLLPCFVVREADGRYSLRIEAPLFPEGEQRESARELMGRLVPVFEDYVRRYPDQWLILHRYWEPASALERGERHGISAQVDDLGVVGEREAQVVLGDGRVALEAAHLQS